MDKKAPKSETCKEALGCSFYNVILMVLPSWLCRSTSCQPGWVRDSIKRAEGQLLEYEERLHLAERFRRIEGVLSSIVGEAEQIEKLNDRFGGAPEIDRCARSIIQLANQLDED